MGNIPNSFCNLLNHESDKAHSLFNQERRLHGGRIGFNLTSDNISVDGLTEKINYIAKELLSRDIIIFKHCFNDDRLELLVSFPCIYDLHILETTLTYISLWIKKILVEL